MSPLLWLQYCSWSDFLSGVLSGAQHEPTAPMPFSSSLMKSTGHHRQFLFRCHSSALLPPSSPNLPPLHWCNAHSWDPHSGFSFFHSALDPFQTTVPHSHFLGDYSLCLSSTFQLPDQGSSPPLVRITPSCTSLLNFKTLVLLLGIFLVHQDDQGPHQYLISGLLAQI